MKRCIQALLGIILSFFITSESFAVGSSGFSTQLVGAKALGQGNAFAGEADDPSALYYNPAGITQLKGTQVSIGAAGVVAIIDRTGEGVPTDHMKRQLGVLPNLYLTSSSPFGNDRFSVGVGITSPFGLSTSWAPTSSVAYVTTDSDIQMINVNPTVAYKVSDALSLGAGVDYVNVLDITSNAQINQGALNPGDPDGTSKLKGHGNGWGYNVGVLYHPVEKHSFGLAYRSQVRVPIKGSVNLSNLSSTTQGLLGLSSSEYSADATSSIILPASFLAGYAFRANSQWTLLADYELTGWNSFQSQDVAYGGTVSSTPRNWHNASAVGVGANYKQNDTWQWRGGYAFFQKTVPNDTFSPDVPDSPVHLLTAGFSRTWVSWVLDFAVNTYIYPSRSVNNTVGNSVGASVNGSYHTIAPALALNLTYKFGK